MVQIFAHRGFSGYYPENTMLAFQKVAEETVADGIELDIQLTKDGEIVIMHDEMLDRTTNGSGWLKDHTLEELKMLSVGVNVKGFFPRQTIPTLREYFTWLKTTKLITNIELKTSYFEYEGIEEKAHCYGQGIRSGRPDAVFFLQPLHCCQNQKTDTGSKMRSFNRHLADEHR